MSLDERGQPAYGPRDQPDLQAMRDIGRPFWLAGSYGTAAGLREALRQGAEGVQVGTLFAFCRESGIDPRLKAAVIAAAQSRSMQVFTDPAASPTGFPFKVVGVEDTLSEAGVYDRRTRICDLGYLRQLYRKEDGRIGYRCAAEPEEDYVGKGGRPEETLGRKCLCNGLLSTVGLGQLRSEGSEPAIVTAGDTVEQVAQMIAPGQDSYGATDVVERLLASAEPHQKDPATEVAGSGIENARL
jgi:nitronate monooxygenase